MTEAYSILRQPLVAREKSLGQVTEDVCRPLNEKASPLWWAAFSASFSFLLLGFRLVLVLGGGGHGDGENEEPGSD